MGKIIPVIERFWSKVEKKKFGYKTECWIWIAYRNSHGYGTFRGEYSKHPGGYTGRVAHRWAYEHFIKKISKGFELDHLCRNKACVNPEHLAEVTHAENMKANRGIYSSNVCKKGHILEGDNLLIRRRDRKDNSEYREYRVCRTCKREYERIQYFGSPEEMLKRSRKVYYKDMAVKIINNK